MKIREIILELREYMDRSKYGAWVNAETKEITKVGTFDHRKEMDIIAQEKGINPDNSYLWGFANHYVRVAFDRRNEINIQGLYLDINAAAQLLLATCVQPDITSVNIDFFRDPKKIRKTSTTKNFNMPVDRREMMMFMKGETE